ncbi:tRNA (cytidine(34)-2'-O)-methyltransferase [Stappia indica]|uniref:tRNA (cytidine(34)-2'-O)-methyltransferase n=1 Tax=Stappia indica TaxID=538381 RepID=A0A285RD33_9HYPH|nr:tRNA (cytidine(34)-2'-O)-methyltransferase [Stappia indica]SOB90287.1 tRNA (cytidine/uridine-2'-O-)-methyltransferase [Stappia indica]
MPDLVLFQPDIPQNTGTILRLGACLGVTVHVIEPAGFPLSDHALRRAGMDYLERAAMVRHVDFPAFEAWRREQGRRLVLLTTSGAVSHLDHAFAATDLLMLGRESSGVPQDVHALADARLTVPMVAGMRSLNVAVTAAIVLGEALRQTSGFPSAPQPPAAGSPA